MKHIGKENVMQNGEVEKGVLNMTDILNENGTKHIMMVIKMKNDDRKIVERNEDKKSL